MTKLPCEMMLAVRAARNQSRNSAATSLAPIQIKRYHINTSPSPSIASHSIRAQSINNGGYSFTSDSSEDEQDEDNGVVKRPTKVADGGERRKEPTGSATGAAVRGGGPSMLDIPAG